MTASGRLQTATEKKEIEVGNGAEMAIQDDDGSPSEN